MFFYSYDEVILLYSQVHIPDPFVVIKKDSEISQVNTYIYKDRNNQNCALLVLLENDGFCRFKLYVNLKYR